MKMMLLTDHYPPLSSVASIRMAEFVKTFSSQQDTQVRIVCYNPIGKNKHAYEYEKLSGNVDISWYRRKYLPGFFHTLMIINPFTLLNWFLITAIEVRRYTPDIIITTVPSLSSTISASAVAKLKNIPTCIDLRDNWVNPSMSGLALPTKLVRGTVNNKVKAMLRLSEIPIGVLTKLFYKLFIRSCNSASLISVVYDRSIKDLGIYSRYNKKIILVQNGVNFTELTSIKKSVTREDTLKKYGLAKGKNDKYIVHVGSFDTYYRPEVLFRYVSALQNRGINLNYLIVGVDALDDMIKEQINRYGIKDHVFCMGKKSHEEVLELLLCSDIAFYALDDSFPAPESALGVKVLEYVSCELPILSIAPPESSVTKLIDRNNIGIALQWNELDLVESSLIKLLCDETFRTNIKKSYGNFVDEYDRGRNNKRLYDEIAKTIKLRTDEKT